MTSATPDAQYEKLLTPAEVGRMFRCDPKTITRWAKAGKLTSVRTLGNHRRYKESEVLELLARPADPPPPDPRTGSIGTLWPAVGPGSPVAKLKRRLRDAGIATAGDLTGKTAAELAAECRLRPEQVDEVRLALANKGFTLRGEILDQEVA
jgi:excisionase family DNA binding protein